MQLRAEDQFLELKDVPNDFLFQYNKHYCSFVTDLEDELENAYNRGNIPIANVDTPRTADIMKRATAILTSERELLGQIRWKHS
jgi:hypothetical protein